MGVYCLFVTLTENGAYQDCKFQFGKQVCQVTVILKEGDKLNTYKSVRVKLHLLITLIADM